MDVAFALMLLPFLVVAITVHEFAHAWSAWKLGDGYARRQGRVSLNPFRHLSPLGTLCILLLPFGWGKPVPVNLHNFRRPRRDYLLTSLAGPAANLLLVGVALGLMQITRRSFLVGPGLEPLLSLAHAGLVLLAIINLLLAIINLIPIPPLDGSKIWPVLIHRIKPTMAGKHTWVFLVVLVFLLTTHALEPVLDVGFAAFDAVTPTTDRETYEIKIGAAYSLMDEALLDAAGREIDAADRLNPRGYETEIARAWLSLYGHDAEGAREHTDAARRLGAPEQDLALPEEWVAAEGQFPQPQGRPADAARE